MTDVNGHSEEDLRAFCRAPEDFYRPESKALIGRVLAHWLGESCVTPTELVSLAAHQKRLELAGMARRNAIDRIAGAQARTAKMRGADRIQELTKLVEAQLQVASRHANWVTDHRIDKLGVDAVLAAAHAESASDPWMSEARLLAALSQALSDLNRWDHKIARLLDLIDGARSSDALSYLDALMGEVLASPDATDILLDRPDSLRTQLQDIIALIAGQPAPRDDLQPAVSRLQKAIAERALDKTRSGLVDAMARHLTSPQALTREFEATPANQEARIEELKAVGGVYREMLSSPVTIVDPRLTQAFEVRMSRVFNEDSMTDLLRGRPLGDQVDLLGVFQDHVIGARAVGLVQATVERLYSDDRLPDKLLDIGGEPIDRIRRLGRAARTLDASEIPELFKQSMLDKLEAYQSELLRKANLLGLIHKGPQSNTAKGLALLDLCGKACLIPGRNLEAAHKLTRHFLAQSDFLPGFLQGAQGRERDRRMAILKNKLKISGLS